MSWNGRYVIIYRRYIAVDLEWRKYHDRLFIKMILHSYLMIGEINILWLIANERKTIILKNNTKSYVVVVLASICDLNRSIERGWWGGRGGTRRAGERLLVVKGGGREIQITFPCFSLAPPPCHIFADICVGWCERLCSPPPPQMSSKTWQGGGAKVRFVPLISSNLSH
jgi:hypothetical protein